ncbi:AfsR/SARP family transcriptional regulator [Micromonospora haikouensis]|uniref:AfsR/SARP family transcriptional regulator n=1 Tax=Micromonospora haikouensis TaxID=686309 RepID=UPI003D75966B
MITQRNTGEVVNFQFLGPLNIKVSQSSLHLPGARNRTLLAALLVDANRAISIDRLIDVVWDDQPPATAREQIQNRIGKLRSFLQRGGSADKIIRLGNSYTLEVFDENVDGLRFRGLCAEARTARRNQELDRAASLLRHGLTLWRGSAIQDIDSPALRADAIRWDEERLRAVEDVVDIEISLNQNPHALIADLHCWVNAYPYHEGLHCRLAEALYEASRTAESVTVLRELRKRLHDEMGIRPNPAVVQLEQRILSEGDNAPDSDRPLLMDRQAAEALRCALSETTKALKILTTALS